AFSGGSLSRTNFATRPLSEAILSLTSGELVRCSTLDRLAPLPRAHSHADDRGGRSNTSRKYEPKPSCGRSPARACFDILLNAVFVPQTWSTPSSNTSAISRLPKKRAWFCLSC